MIIEKQIKRCRKALAFFLVFLWMIPAVFSQSRSHSYHSSHTGPRGGHYHYSSSGKKVYEKSSGSHYSSGSHHTRTYSYGVQRDAKGKIKRDPSARYEFMKKSGYPHGRPGYVVDHIVPLKKGGCDCPSNMQWQTKQAAKEKDKWE